jgi:hypothetical protein
MARPGLMPFSAASVWQLALQSMLSPGVLWPYAPLHVTTFGGQCMTPNLHVAICSRTASHSPLPSQKAYAEAGPIDLTSIGELSLATVILAVPLLNVLVCYHEIQLVMALETIMAGIMYIFLS